MNPRIPRRNPHELALMKGGELVVTYLECVRRYEKLPDAGWLRKRLDDYGGELYRRMLLGTLSDVLCGLLAHTLDGPWGSATCTCETPSVEEGGWGQPAERSEDLPAVERPEQREGVA